MRITFVLPFAGLAGGNRVAAIYAQRLQARGHQVVVVSTPRRLPTLREKLRSLRRGRGWPRVPRDEASYFQELDVEHRVIDRHRAVADADVPDADVVIATWWETAEWVAALSDRKGVKAYLIQNDEMIYYPGPDPRLPRVAATYALAMHKITIAHWLVDLARARAPEHPVDLVLNSVDTTQFHAPPRGKQTHPTVGLLYSAAVVKGVDVSLRALALARQRVAGLRLVTFGATKPSRDLPLPTDAQFHLRPAQDSIRNIYASCDVWLCGSRCEGFHLPPLEAMACRCPVVSTRVGGPQDMIANGVNGFLIDVGDASGLADRLVEVLSFNEPRWRAMSDAALATAARYTWDDATLLFEKALERAVARAARGEIAGKPLHARGVA